MASNVKKLKRVFKVGATQIEDPAPGQPLAVAVRLLSQTHPQFRLSRLYEEDGEIVGNSLVFNLKMPAAKTNG